MICTALKGDNVSEEFDCDEIKKVYEGLVTSRDSDVDKFESNKLLFDKIIEGARVAISKAAATAAKVKKPHYRSFTKSSKNGEAALLSNTGCKFAKIIILTF